MIAVAADPLQEPTAADDAATAAWMDVHKVKASGALLFPWCSPLFHAPERLGCIAECVPSVVDVLKLAMQTITPKALQSSD